MEAEDQGASEESRTAGADQHRAMSVAAQQAQLRAERVREANATTLSKAFSPKVKVVKKVPEVTVEVAIDRTPKKKQFLQKVCADSVADSDCSVQSLLAALNADCSVHALLPVHSLLAAVLIAHCAHSCCSLRSLRAVAPCVSTQSSIPTRVQPSGFIEVHQKTPAVD